MNLAELCCGSAALTLHLHGARPPMPYMGSKERYAAAIAETFGLERPQRTLLVDTGMWADAWSLLCRDGARSRVVEACVALVADCDPRELWQRLRVSPPPACPVERVAAWVVLQRLAFSGKPVVERADGSGWSDPGFQETAGYGRPGTPRFGEVLPQLPALPSRLAALPVMPHAWVVRSCATDVPVPEDAAEWVLYLDPPYAGTTGYADSDLTREDVLALARSWADAGAHVIVSEAEPLPLAGWHTVEITGQRTGKRSSWQLREWLTSNRPPVQRSLFAGAA